MLNPNLMGSTLAKQGFLLKIAVELRWGQIVIFSEDVAVYNHNECFIVMIKLLNCSK